jgi:glycosyltransferase involved in cell wall biosynthesis
VRLVYVSAYYPPYTVGGAEENTFALAGALRARGHDVRVLAPRLGAGEPATDVPVETVEVGVSLAAPGRPLRPRVFDRPSLQRRLARAVTRVAGASDLVHCQSLELLPAAYAGARRAGVPIVATIQDLVGVCPIAVCLLDRDRVPGDCGIAKLERECVPSFLRHYDAGSRARVSAAAFVRFLTGRGRSRLLRRCDGVYSVGSDLGPLYGSAGLLDPARVDVLPNVVEPLAAPGPDAGDGRRPYAVFAGRVTPGKGAPYLLEAAASVRAEEPDFRLVVAGYAEERWRARLGAEPAVEYLGRVDRARVAALYAGARLAVVPSVWPEPLGRSVLEAALCGVPSVASAAGGLPDTIEDGTTGLLVPPRDADALAAAILRLWRDPALAASLGAAAARHVAERFGAARIGERAERLYVDALAAAA